MNKMENKNHPVYCPAIGNGCDSNGVCDCSSRAGSDYRECLTSLNTARNKTQDRIMLFGSNIVGGKHE